MCSSLNINTQYVCIVYFNVDVRKWIENGQNNNKYKNISIIMLVYGGKQQFSSKILNEFNQQIKSL